MSSKFVRIETKSQVHYINQDYIMTVRPADWKSFDSGAAVEVTGDESSRLHLIEAGKHTNDLLSALGLP
jgi:hypothetical protein